MAAVTLRDEYFVEGNDLVRRTGRRPSGYGGWKNARDPKLAVAVEMGDDGIHRVFRGKQHTREREREAVARSYKLQLNESAPDVGLRVPKNVINELRTSVDAIAERVAGRFRNLSNEERMTGALFGQLPDELVLGDWKVRFHSQGYTSVQKTAKETKIGADAGVVVEVWDGGTSVTKALWLQAKRTAEPPLPSEVQRLPGLRHQMKTMDSHTPDGYALIYTPAEVFVTDGKRRWTLGEWLASAVQCERGDRNPTTIVNTMDRDYLLEMTVSNGPL